MGKCRRMQMSRKRGGVIRYRCHYAATFINNARINFAAVAAALGNTDIEDAIPDSGPFRRAKFRRQTPRAVTSLEF